MANQPSTDQTKVVWLAEFSDYSDHAVYGVFESAEAAMNAIDERLPWPGRTWEYRVPKGATQGHYRSNDGYYYVTWYKLGVWDE